MKVSYDAKTDTLTVMFRDVPVAESDEDKPGVILDYDAAGNIVSIGVLDASRRVEEPRTVSMAVSYPRDQYARRHRGCKTKLRIRRPRAARSRPSAQIHPTRRASLAKGPATSQALLL